MPWRRKQQSTPVFLPGEFHGWRSLVGYSSRGRKESDTTEQLTRYRTQGCWLQASRRAIINHQPSYPAWVAPAAFINRTITADKRRYGFQVSTHPILHMWGNWGPEREWACPKTYNTSVLDPAYNLDPFSHSPTQPSIQSTNSVLMTCQTLF